MVEAGKRIDGVIIVITAIHATTNQVSYRLAL